MTKKPFLLISVIANIVMCIVVFITIRSAPKDHARPQHPHPAPASGISTTPEQTTGEADAPDLISEQAVLTREAGRYITSTDCENILKRGMPAYGSPDYQSLRDALNFMLENNSDQAYELLNALPPGDLSAYLVHQIFSSKNYTKYSEIFAVADRITSRDINKAAMEGLITSMIGSSMSKRDRQPIDRPTQSDLDRIKATRMSKDSEISLLNELSRNSAITDEQVAAFIDMKDEYSVRTVISHLPRDTARYILEKSLREGGKVTPRTIQGFAYGTAQVDPLEALEWSYRLPAEQAVIAFASSYQAWVLADPNSASRHLGTLDNSPQKDAGIQILVETAIDDQDLTTAKRWIELISDPAKKEELTSRIRNK